MTQAMCTVLWKTNQRTRATQAFGDQEIMSEPQMSHTEHFTLVYFCLTDLIITVPGSYFLKQGFNLFLILQKSIVRRLRNFRETGNSERFWMFYKDFPD